MTNELPVVLVEARHLGSALNGTVVPKRQQNFPTGPLPLLPVPPSAAIGASTCGVRTPPSTLPFASRTNITGDDAGRLRERAVRRRGAVHHPLVEPVDRRVQHPVRAAGVDRQVAREADDRPDGSFGGFCIAARFRTAPWPLPVSVGSDDEAVVVVVRRARDLPEPELARCRADGRRGCC